MIRKIEQSDLEECVSVIRSSFKTVALNFGITVDNCPNHTSFIKIDKLSKQLNDKLPMYVYIQNEIIVGYFSLSKNDDGSYELNNLSVLPMYRHNGFGQEMIQFAIKLVEEMGGNKITIGIIEDNTELKNWYIKLGFIHKGVKEYRWLPFTVGFMEVVF